MTMTTNEPILTDIPMDRFLTQIEALADVIVASRWRPDWIVGVGRGGLVPATWLSHAIGRPMLSIDLSAKLLSFSEARLADLSIRTDAGERMLVVDDINDSGRTINRLRDAIGARHGNGRGDGPRFAVLMDNIRSAARVDYRAETIDRAVTKDWFVFPWEKVASRTSILADWGEAPDRTA
jgi:uncharacterized protein